MYEEVIYNFVINHFYSIHHFHYATHQTTKSIINPPNSNYKATILLLHVSIQIFTTQNLPTVQAYQIHSRKHNGKAQTIYLNAFIILFRYLG